MHTNGGFSRRESKRPISTRIFGFYLTDALRMEMEEIADELHISLAELIRQSVRWAIDEHRATTQPQKTIKQTEKVTE